MAVAPTSAIREAFPALSRVHRGRPVAYLDGPGGTQVPQPVVDAMADYLLHHNANTHWAYPTSAETDALLADAREVMAELLNGRADEIAFGNNMTTITFHVARALARNWAAGDEVIVTQLDHHANVAPWQAVARDFGIVLKWLPLNLQSGELDLEQLDALLTPRTKLVAVGAASNMLGTVTDVAAVAVHAHRVGALCYVDGVHFVPHFLPDVEALGCDFFACSPYKFYGPHAGVLWGRHDLLARLEVPRLDPAPDRPPEHLETGTQNHEGIVGSAAAVRWLASLDGTTSGSLRQDLAVVYHELHRRQHHRFEQLWHGLATIPAVTRYGPGPDRPRTATLSFTVRGWSAEHVAIALAEAGCFVSHGDFYAATVAQLLGLATEGLVRVGMACYTTEDEVERVVAAIAALGS